MAIKWKKFSRSLKVRFVLNVMLILCIVMAEVLFQYYETHSNSWVPEYSCEYYDLFDYINDDENCLEIKEEFKQGLKEIFLASVQSDNNKKLESLKKKFKDKYNFRVKYADEDMKKNVCLSNVEETDISSVTPLRVEYEGTMQFKNSYSKSWANTIREDGEDSNSEDDFLWLNVNELLAELCKENKDLREKIADNMTNKLSYYSSSMKNVFEYLAGSNEEVSVIEKMPSNIYYKIYGALPAKTNYMIEEYEKLYDNFEYVENLGLYYCDDEEMYYDPETSEWIDSLSAEQERIYREKIKKEQNEVQVKVLGSEGSSKNPFRLSDKEMKVVKGIIESLLNSKYSTQLKESQMEDEEVDEEYSSYSIPELQFYVPISAFFGTPKEYKVVFGMNQSYFQENFQDRINQINADQKAERKEEISYAFKVKMMLVSVYVVIGIGIVIALLLCIFCGRQPDTDEIKLLKIDRWKTEIIIGIIGLIIFWVIPVFITLRMGYIYFGGKYFQGMIPMMVAINLLILLIYVVFQLVLSLIRKAKAKVLYKTSLLYWLVGNAKGLAQHGKLNMLVTVCMLGIGAFTFLMEFVAINTHKESIIILTQGLLLLLFLILFRFVNRYTRSISAILDGTKRMRDGDLEYQIPTYYDDGLLYDLATNINSITEGLEQAVDERIKSERLKTELISNVSHDIKTPLTSIITYVDLLKREDVQPEKAKEYVEVLDQKSQRLKVLTDDLFEAAKATSGAMATDITKIDMGSLINQAAGEFEEKFERSGLIMKNNVEPDTYFVMADGRLAWRIIENIFSNASKYAQADSRVYVDCNELEDTMEIVVKNISAYELNITAEELMERFTRGDKSRNTEGSGLGLDIAKSLATLQNGEFTVEIDGDLFKSILRLPKAK